MNKIYLTEVVLLTKSYNLQDFKDWLHWHLDIIRFNHVHIFDNESSVDIKTVCDSYGDKVSYEKITGWPNQYALYNRYINNESKAWWVLPIDDDEYLWMKNFTDVNDMIMFYQEKWKDMTKLSIRWKNMFPDNVENVREEQSLMDFCKNSNEQWASCMDGGNLPVKTFVKTIKKLDYSLPANETHNPINGDLSYMCNGIKLKGNWFKCGPFTDDDLKILHYQFKSKKEWIIKCNRNNDAGVKSRGHYMKHYENAWEKMK